MPHKKRKVRKQRGSRTHGYGRVSQHRGGGQRGGRGKTGSHKHKWTQTVNLPPKLREERGFQPPKGPVVNAINIGKLDEQVERLLEEKTAEKTKEGITVNLTQLGYEKLLGGGTVNHPLIVTVKSSSKSAAEKVEKAGGRILQAE